MSEVSKVPNTVLLIKDQRACRRCVTLCCTMNNWSKAMYVWGVESGVCGLHNTAYWVLLLMLEVLKVYCTLYTVASCPCQEGRLFVTVQYLKGLPSWGFSGSPPVSPRRQLCQLSWAYQTTRVIAGKMHSQSSILKTKGPLSNPVILTYLQRKLHPPYPNQTACL